MNKSSSSFKQGLKGGLFSTYKRVSPASWPCGATWLSKGWNCLCNPANQTRKLYWLYNWVRNSYWILPALTILTTGFFPFVPQVLELCITSSMYELFFSRDHLDILSLVMSEQRNSPPQLDWWMAINFVYRTWSLAGQGFGSWLDSMFQTVFVLSIAIFEAALGATSTLGFPKF